MKMNRRYFIKSIAVVVASATVPFASKAVRNTESLDKEAEKGKEYGNATMIGVADLAPQEIDSIIRNILLPDARKLFSGRVVEIRAQRFNNYGKITWGVAWYTNDRIARKQEKYVAKPEFDASFGGYFCGRIAV